MGYVDTSRGGVTELRVHGVSGTSPEAMLCHPHVQRVAGDGDAGFYRRVWESALTAEDHPAAGAVDGADRLEGYSWGGLTSGGWTRALYLLLLPFLLVNVGFYATPRSPLEIARGGRLLRRFSEGVQRVFALSLTLTMTLAVVEVAVDIVGWQCGRTAATCGSGPLVAVPDWSWLRQTGPRLAASAVVPVLVVLLLWWLAHRSWRQAEAIAPPAAAAQPETWASPLEGRSFWNGGEAVANLRAFHITAGLAAVGLSVTTPLLGPPGTTVAVLWSGPASALAARILAGVLILLLIGCVLGVAAPGLARRAVPSAAPAAWPPRLVSGWRSWLPIGTLLLVIVAGALTAFGGLAPPERRGSSILPWLTWGIGLVFWSQAGLLLLLSLLTAAQARGSSVLATAAFPPAAQAPAAPRGGWPGVGRPVASPPAWRGMAVPVFVLLAWVVASGFAAALTLRLADTVGTPVAAVGQATGATLEATAGTGDPSQAKSVLLPVGYFWASAEAVAMLVVIAGMAVALAVWFFHEAKGLREVVTADYGLDRPQVAHNDGQNDVDEDLSERAAGVARAWALGLAPNEARWLAGVMLGLVGLVLCAGLVGYALDQTWIVDHRSGWWAALLGAGNLVMTLAVLGLLYVGRQSFSDVKTRRLVGILWDVGTFWPRATHPLAPPSYGERAIPDMLSRMEGLTGLDAASRDEPGCTGVVALSCHSQGSVIGAAAVAASRYDVLERTAFLTYGDPLRRLYARFFPAYFGLPQLERLGRLLTSGVNAPAPGQWQPSSAEERARWPWRNLQRRPDPIGGCVFVEAHVATANGPLPDDVDIVLVDPVFLPGWGDRSWPPVLAHSDYYLDPQFGRVLAEVVRRREACSVPVPRPA